MKQHKQIYYNGRLCHLGFFGKLEKQLDTQWHNSFMYSNEFGILLDMFDTQIMRQFEYKYE